jgi:hypothetical protein
LVGLLAWLFSEFGRTTMVGRRHREIPAPLSRGRDRFEVWRRTRQVGTRIPDELWSLAVKLADHHGISRTASVLGLDYYSLKKRVEAGNSGVTSVPSAFVEGSASSDSAFVEGSASSDSASARPAFIELSSSSLQGVPSMGVSNECVVEFEDGAGARLRVHLRGSDAPDLVACGLVALGRSFWSAE